MVGSEVGEDLVALLVALAVNPSLDTVAAPLREKALVLALQLNPVDRDARRALSALSRQMLPEDVNAEDAVPVPEIAELIVERAGKLDLPDQSKDESTLRAYLLAVAIEADAEGGEKWKTAMREAATLAGVKDWQGAVKERNDTNLLFGSASTVIPEVTPSPEDPAVSLPDFSTLGFALPSAATHALSSRRFNSRSKMPSETKFSRLTANLELANSEEKQPSLRVEGGMTGSGQRGFQPMRLMSFVRSRYPDWSPQANVVLKFEKKDFGQPGKVAELPVVLALLALMSGDEPVSNVLPLGGVESDGKLATIFGLGDLLVKMPDEATQNFLVVPAEAELDLVDLANRGSD